LKWWGNNVTLANALPMVVTTFQKPTNSVDSKEHTSTFSSFMKVDAMSGASVMQLATDLEKSQQDEVASLRNDLLNRGPEHARVTAAFIRASYDVRAQAKAAGRGVVTMVDGKVTRVDPDSPIFPDLSLLVPLVKQLFPLPPDEEPPGFE
jgi:hypothetical protein